MPELHPTDMPGFDMNRTEPVWYLAHPLKTDDQFSRQQNMDHIVHLMRLFYRNDIRVVAPYHTIMLALDDSNPEDRRVGLEVDCFIARRLGRILLTGHKMGKGMEIEVRAAQQNGMAWWVADLVGYNDDKIIAWCEANLTQRVR